MKLILLLLPALLCSGCITLTAPLAFQFDLPRHGGKVDATLFPDRTGKLVVTPAK